MTTVPRLQDVCNAIVTAVQAALAASGAPGVGQVYVGWPTAPEEVQKLGQPFPSGSITVYPLRSAMNATRYSGEATIIAAPQHNLFATVSHNTVTFAGTSDQPYNIHGFFAGKSVDAYMATTQGQSLSSIATAYAAAINALAVGLSASASGAEVTLASGQFLDVNIGSSGQYAIEEMRISRTIQVSVWINHVPTRWIVTDSIISGLGTSDNHFLTLSDGSQAYIRYLSDMVDDSSASAYSLYVSHIWFEVEYGQITSGKAYEIEGIKTVQTINQGTPVTAYSGG